MALASQTGGPVRRNRYMYRRRRTRPGRWMAFLLLIAIVVCGVWYFMPGSEEENRPANTLQPRSTLAGQQSTPATRENTPTLDRPATTQQPASTTPPAREVPTRMVEVEEVSPASETRDRIAAITGSRPNEDLDSMVVPVAPTLMVATHTDANNASESVRKSIELAQTNPLVAREQLTALLESGTLSDGDREKVRAELTMLGKLLLFERTRLPQDEFTRHYVIQNGDSLARIASREKLNADWRLIQRMNGIQNPNAIQVGSSLKLPVGTFHAIVYKNEYLMELYLQNNGGRIMVGTYPVGLGSFNSTPTGPFKVRENSKLINPQWTNPRTGEFFASNNPQNPIGERWIGLAGTSANNSGMLGYGIHGTIEPDSIGRMESMGCIRMRDDDVCLIYEVLSDRGSTIEIRD